MNENKAEPMDLEFKIVFKGYSVPEVNEYIMQLRSEIEDIRKENGELYRKLEFYSTEMENYRTDEASRKEIIRQAKEEAEEIISEAKKQAAKEVLRGNRLCSRMVADMVSQVEEQKKLFIATKTEAANFRRELFERYRVHIELINAMSEATGVFDGNEISATELEDVKRLLESTELAEEGEKQTVDISTPASSEEGTNLFMDAFSDTASFGAVAAPLKNKKGKNRRSVLNLQNKKKSESSEESSDSKQSQKKAAGDTEGADKTKSISELRNDTIYGEKELYQEFSVPVDVPQAEPLPEAEEISAVISEIEAQPELQAAQAAPEKEENTAELPVQQSEPQKTEEKPEQQRTPQKTEEEAKEQKAEKAPAQQSVPRKVQEARPMKIRPVSKPVEAVRNDAFVMTEEDLDEFGNPDGDVMEYDSPVSVDSVFKKSPYKDKDFEMLYGEVEKPEVTEPKKARSTPAASVEGVERKFNGYGFDVSHIDDRTDKYDPDDDSDEFYMEDDDEFDPAAVDGVPTGTVSSFGISVPGSTQERRWKVKRSKSLTDEFDVIQAQEEE